ncbi:hypothetical protein [Tenacibaculum jejuense]|uniref:Uncharacterized protein n=1 Tax=Tenacibaculum jejuense TaxID=584609 RepID=A0A238U768_9FLAO|nr:hypothetical protein [Tenacibaculum jejuense]SNR15049.1 Probable transmembrane protein of unknown function [Tenacibaculum jejuense]
MIKITPFLSRYNFIFIPLLLLISLIILSLNFQSNPEIAPYFIIDFLFTIPVVYFLLIRKKDIHKFTVVSVFILGVLFSSFLIPIENQGILELAKLYIIPILELVVFSTILLKVRKLYQGYKNNNTQNHDFFETIHTASLEIFPSKIASFLATEITVFYYAFFKWKSTTVRNNEFTYHKEGTYTGILLGILLVIVIETFVLHVLVAEWSIVTAWIFSGFSIYTFIQVVAILKSIRSRRIVVDEENQKLYLRFGFLGKVEVDFRTIKSVRSASYNTENIDHLSFIGSFTGANIIIDFKEEISYNYFYGVKKKCNSLALIVDDKVTFIERVQNLINK